MLHRSRLFFQQGGKLPSVGHVERTKEGRKEGACQQRFTVASPPPRLISSRRIPWNAITATGFPTKPNEILRCSFHFSSSPPSFLHRVFNFPRCTRSMRGVDWKNSVDLWGFGWFCLDSSRRSFLHRRLRRFFASESFDRPWRPSSNGGGRVADRKGAQAMIFIARR